MSDPAIPGWLKSLPLAPEYHPTETEFADPIAFISRIEREAAAFGICKVIPPLPRPSKRFVLSNLSATLNPTHFTTRHQELGARRRSTAPKQQVWQSGHFYTLDQFEAKSRSFARSHLPPSSSCSPLLVESLFWKAAADKPIYIEYANDVPGSGFAPFKKRTLGLLDSGDGRQLSNSRWNLQAIARAPGSLTRFMPDEVPGVTSPMVYIGMLFSWFAWHIEDHELHSLNFLHTGAPKTWYAVPAEHAVSLEETVRVKGYGGNMDRIEAFAMLGEKTTLLSPEVLVASGVPCCRLVQRPGEFVVTFPRAYHVGFSHGFNCGEAANFATPQWLNVAKEAAVRRAAMNYLPMLSHQQLLYLLTMSFISRIPRELLPGVRCSRLRDRKKEEREVLVKKAFLNDMMNENHLLCALLAKELASSVILWEPEMLPSPCNDSHSFSSFQAHVPNIEDSQKEKIPCSIKEKVSIDCRTGTFGVETGFHEAASSLASVSSTSKSSFQIQKAVYHTENMNSSVETLEGIDDEDELPYGLDIDSGPLACVACGTLGYPFMAIVQPSESARKELFPVNSEEFHQKSGKSGCVNLRSCSRSIIQKINSGDSKEAGIKSEGHVGLNSGCLLYTASSDHALLTDATNVGCGIILLNDDLKEPSSDTNAVSLHIGSANDDGPSHFSNPVEHLSNTFSPLDDSADGLHCCARAKEFKKHMHMKANATAEHDPTSMTSSDLTPFVETSRLHGGPIEEGDHELKKKWNTSSRFVRPQIFCLQHALEIEELLRCKGGANVLIICHSDYVKIKAHAKSVAEDIGVNFVSKDVPLENASSEYLDLINISINGEHEECSEDWTSKLGLNLRYCIKLRKQSSKNKEQFPIALGGIFSDRFPITVASDLKWRCRKPRTPYKIIGTILSNQESDVKLEKVELLTRKSNADSIKEIQVYQSRKKGPNPRDRSRRGAPKEFSNKEMGTLADRDSYNSIDILNDEVEINNIESLHTAKMTICDRMMSRCHQPYIKGSIFDGSETLANLHTLEEPCSGNKVCGLEKSGHQREIVVTEVDSSGVQHCEMKVASKNNSAQELNRAIESVTVSSAGRAVADSEFLQKIPISQEASRNFDMQIQMPVSEKRLQLERHSIENCNSGMQDLCCNNDIERNGKFWTEISETEGNGYLRTSNEQEGLYCIRETKENDKMSYVKSSRSPVVGSAIETSEAHLQTWYCDNVKSAPTVDNSEKPGLPLPVGNMETYGMHEMVDSRAVENAPRVIAHSIQNNTSKDNRRPIVVYKSYVRRNKRKREEKTATDCGYSCNAFVRGPCERLRPRSGRAAYERGVNKRVNKEITAKVNRRQMVR